MNIIPDRWTKARAKEILVRFEDALEQANQALASIKQDAVRGAAVLVL